MYFKFDVKAKMETLKLLVELKLLGHSKKLLWWRN